MRRSNLNGPGFGETQYQPTEQMLEEENAQLEESLKGKVQALKSMSIDIGTEVRHQNKMISGMDDDFDKTGNFLEATMGRLKRLTRAGHWKLWLYLLLFAFFVIIMCWLIIRF
ncbi:BET1 homolog [Littorina saxatilis]|uniref:BET1 homolog n=1 Tax=Littorina saxatilis TaxID=31220 RepID=A0AAN9G7H4_9CAEN